MLLPILYFCFIVISFVLEEAFIQDEYSENLENIYEKQKRKREEKTTDMYVLLLKNGNRYTRPFELFLSQVVIAILIRFDFDATLAWSGYTSTLIQRCLRFDKHCSYASNFYKYSIKMRFTHHLILSDEDFETFAKKVDLN